MTLFQLTSNSGIAGKSQVLIPPFYFYDYIFYDSGGGGVLGHLPLYLLEVPF